MELCIGWDVLVLGSIMGWDVLLLDSMMMGSVRGGIHENNIFEESLFIVSELRFELTWQSLAKGNTHSSNTMSQLIYTQFVGE